MHKPFQKFGFFVSNSVDEETNTKNDKTVKYLYRKDHKIREKSPKQKIRSANDADNIPHFKKKVTEGKHRSHMKKSRESSTRSKRRNSINNNFLSETEIYFISPEEIKKHKKQLQKSRDKSSERLTESKKKYDEYKNITSNKQLDRKRSLKGDEDIVKLIKHYRQKTGVESEDYQWLTKKDIFKLLSNIKNIPKTTGSTNFLRKLFTFDKEDVTRDRKKGNQQSERYERQRVQRYSENNNMTFLPFKASFENINKKLEKMTNPHEKNKHEREQKRHQEKTKVKENHTVQKCLSDSNNNESVIRSLRKEKSRAIKEDVLIFDELEVSQNIQTDNTKTLRKKKKEDGRHNIAKDKIIQVETETRKQKKHPETSSVLKEEPQWKLKSVSRANPLRHKYCLVKNTFSIISIAPQNNSFLENRKKLKAFKKYYKYSRSDKDSEVTTSNAYHTFSDSHKMYQDISDQSFVETPEKLINNVRRKHSLQLETHISAVVISPKMSIACGKVSSQCSKSSEKKCKVKRQKSKIPVLNSTAKIVELIDDSVPTSKSRQMSAELFTPKTRNEETQVDHKRKSKPDDISKIRDISPAKLSPRNSSSERFEEIDKTKQASCSRVRDKSPSHLSSRHTSVERSKEKSKRTTPRSNKSDGEKQKNSSRTTSVETRSSKPHSDKSDTFSEKVHHSKQFKNQSPGSISPRSTSIERNKEHMYTKERNQNLKVKNKSDNSPKSPKEILHSKLASRRANEKEVSTRMKEKKTQTPELKNKKEIKTSRTSTPPRESKINDAARKPDSKNSLENKNKLSSKPSSQRNCNESLDSGPNSKKSHLKFSNDVASSVSSRKSKRTNKSAVPSKSDTRLQQSNKTNAKKRYQTKKSATKTSISNSTFGDKSMVSSKNETSFLLTKSYKDDEKLNRWQKRKMYSDTLRKNLINKSQKAASIPPQVLEVRYLTVTKDNDEITGSNVMTKHSSKSNDFISSDLYLHNSEGTMLEVIPSTSKDFYDDDLPPSYMELVEPDRFKNIFDLPMDTALNEILSENYNFLKKDFSFTNLNDLYKYSSSEDNVSTGDLNGLHLEKPDEWYDFCMPSDRSISEIFPCRKKSNINVQTLDLGSQDHIVDSLSAPGSEESGYSTLKSRHMSRSFFERPEIKALFDPPLESSVESYCVEVQIERTSSSSCGLEIKSIESKSLQTSVQSSQKSVQIKLSQEELVNHTINERSKKIIIEDESKSRTEEPVDHEDQDGDTTIQKEFCEDVKSLQNNKKATPEYVPNVETTEYDKNVAQTIEITTVDKSKQIISVHRLITDENTRKELKKKTRKLHKKFKCKVSFLSCFKGVSSGE